MGSNIYAGVSGDSLGIYLSSNNGTSWSKCYYESGWSVISLSKNTTTIFAVTGATYYMSRIMRSTNMGQNWTMMLNNMNIYTTETNGNDIYAGTTLGVYRSTNNGVNWASASLSSYYIRSIGVIGTNIYAGAANFGIFYTTNNGANWNQSVIANQDILSLAVNFYRKISLHMIGIGGFTGLFLGLSLNFGINLNTEMIAGILLAGIIGFARLKSNSHQPAEIYTGFLMGVLVMTVLMTLL